MESEDPADDFDNWDEIEQYIDPDNDSDEEVVQEQAHRDERKVAALQSGHAAIQMAKQKKKHDNSAASALAKQRNLLAKRNDSPRPFSPSKGPSPITELSPSLNTNRKNAERLTPVSPRPSRAAPVLRASGPRQVPPSLILPSERTESPGPFRTNTPLPNIRASKSLTNINNFQPAPPSMPKTPKMTPSPRIRRRVAKKNSLEELCDQLNDKVDLVSKSEEYHHDDKPPPVQRSMSSEPIANRLMLPLERPRSPSPGLDPLPPSSPRLSSSFQHKPVLKPI